MFSAPADDPWANRANDDDDEWDTDPDFENKTTIKAGAKDTSIVSAAEAQRRLREQLEEENAKKFGTVKSVEIDKGTSRSPARPWEQQQQQQQPVAASSSFSQPVVASSSFSQPVVASSSFSQPVVASSSFSQPVSSFSQQVKVKTSAPTQAPAPPRSFGAPAAAPPPAAKPAPPPPAAKPAPPPPAAKPAPPIPAAAPPPPAPAPAYEEPAPAYDEYQQEGYDQGGYDQSGYDQSGYDQSGYDHGSYDQSGYDQGGYEQGSYDQGGYEQGGGGGGGKQCRALYDYPGENESDLAFYAGAVINVTNDTDPSGWWEGELDGVVGWFPSNFIELI